MTWNWGFQPGVSILFSFQLNFFLFKLRFLNLPSPVVTADFKEFDLAVRSNSSSFLRLAFFRNQSSPRLASVTVNFKDCIWLTDWCNTNWNCSWKLVKASIEIPHHATIVSYSCSLIFPAARCGWVGKWRKWIKFNLFSDKISGNNCSLIFLV